MELVKIVQNTSFLYILPIRDKVYGYLSRHVAGQPQPYLGGL